MKGRFGGVNSLVRGECYFLTVAQAMWYGSERGRQGTAGPFGQSNPSQQQHSSQNSAYAWIDSHVQIVGLAVVCDQLCDIPPQCFLTEFAKQQSGFPALIREGLNGITRQEHSTDSWRRRKRLNTLLVTGSAHFFPFSPHHLGSSSSRLCFITLSPLLSSPHTLSTLSPLLPHPSYPPAGFTRDRTLRTG